jgi:hypothetical protein
MAAASILIAWKGGADALRGLWRDAFEIRAPQTLGWLGLALAFKPLVAVASYGILGWLGRDLPEFTFDPVLAIGLFALFFLAAIGEEMGWTAYVTPTLIRRIGVIGAGLLLGAFEVVWHLVPMLQVGRDLDWIAWWALGAVAQRLIIVWLFARSGGGTPTAILFHTMSNVSWMMFPVMGSHYDPVSTSLILAVVALCCSIFTKPPKLRTAA